MAMLTGLAQGGPRDGVKLSCPGNWNGKVIKRQHGPAYHDGYYLWDTAVNTWVWQAGKMPPEPEPVKMPAGRPLTSLRKRKPFAGYQYRQEA